LREQVFESVFCSDYEPEKKQELSDWLNKLFAGQYAIKTNKTICHIDFEASDSDCRAYKGIGKFEGFKFVLDRIGHMEIQRILTESFSAKVEPTLSEAVSESIAAEADSIAAKSNFKQVEGFNSVEASANPAVGNTEKNEAMQVEALIEVKSSALDEELKEKCVRLNIVLKSYAINAEPVTPELVQKAARFYRFKLMLRPGESINNLKKKREDIARELEAVGEVFIDNIRGTRFVGLDVPFSDCVEPLPLLDNLYRLSETQDSLGILAGQQPDGRYQCIDLAKAPHMLIAGTTGSGKTIFLYSIIVSLLSRMSTDELELLIIDPKQTDFHFFESLPFLRDNRVLVNVEEALEALEKINTEDKEERTQQIRSANSRDIDSYNAKNPVQRMKRLVVIIDEYADLVQAAELQGKEVRRSFEANLCMLVQRVRNLGIHFIIATQQPRSTIVTSSLKAVLPFRVSFRLPSHVDSQTILDRAGAEDLLGKGDMLMQTDSDLLRMQSFFIREEELIAFLDTKRMSANGE
jgi:DNA segregation ATPase FtsK/SpoIIIE-like protein